MNFCYRNQSEFEHKEPSRGKSATMTPLKSNSNKIQVARVQKRKNLEVFSPVTMIVVCNHMFKKTAHNFRLINTNII